MNDNYIYLYVMIKTFYQLHYIAGLRPFKVGKQSSVSQVNFT